MNKKELIKFELEIKNLYESKKIKAPIHLSGNNEDKLIKIFKKISKNDWVFSSWRSHYHALLHGIKKGYKKSNNSRKKHVYMFKFSKVLLLFNSWGHSTYCFRSSYGK